MNHPAPFHKKTSQYNRMIVGLWVCSMAAFWAGLLSDGMIAGQGALPVLLSLLMEICGKFLCSAGFIAGLVLIPLCIMGIARGRKHRLNVLPCVIVLIIQALIAAALAGAVIFIGRGFESTSSQFRKLSRMPEIEEFIITYDDDDFLHDGTMHNDFELYLTDGGFLKVKDLTESMDSMRFRIESIGPYEVSVKEDSGEAHFLELSGMSFLAGRKITVFQDVLDSYTLILKRLECSLYIEQNGKRMQVELKALDRSRLAVREAEFAADLRSMPHVVSATKQSFLTSYMQYYKYALVMDDGLQFDMTLSTVRRKDGEYVCDFFIPSYDNREAKHVFVTDSKRGTKYYKPYESWRFEADTGITVKSYHELFSNYKAFKSALEAFLQKQDE